MCVFSYGFLHNTKHKSDKLYRMLNSFYEHGNSGGVIEGDLEK